MKQSRLAEAVIRSDIGFLYPSAGHGAVVPQHCREFMYYTSNGVVQDPGAAVLLDTK
jgi:hypothetical protein